jgi:hypothetical protein
VGDLGAQGLRGLHDAADAADMLAGENSGFSIDSSVRITRGPPTDWGELAQVKARSPWTLFT